MVSKHDSRKRTVLNIISLILTAILLFLGFRVLSVLDQYRRTAGASDDDAYAYQNGGRPKYLVDGKWYVQKENVETFLLIGIDKYEAAIKNETGYRNSEQSDALFLLAVDNENKTYSIIHINRDTMANIRMLDVNGIPYKNFEGQLALSHTFGSGHEDSCENTVWSVSDYLYGLVIDHYASISMDAVEVLNDKVGGVTVTIPDDMTSVDESFVKGETVTLTGEAALKFIRARGELTDSSNLSRMSRQRQYVNSFIEQSKMAISENSGLASDMILSISEYLVSDMSAEELISLADMLYSHTFEGIGSIDGEARKGEQFMEFYADEAALQKLVLDTFYDEQ